MPATIFSGSKVKALKKILNMNGGSDLISSTNDPTSVATDGLPGSLLMNETTGFVYRKLDSGSTTNWKKLSSGGETGINYILNPDAEVNTSGWAAYADAAGVVPVNGTGGSPTVTWTRSTSSPLRGSGSFLLTKDAANRQGEGASYDFTIDSADINKNLNISFDFAVASGTFASGVTSDVQVFIYDITNAALIYPIAQSISGQSGSFQTTFPTNTSLSYRLILHVATTSASAYTLKFDNFNVGPQQVVLGPIISDMQSYTPTFTGFGTCTNINFKYGRFGQHLIVEGYFTSGTATGVEAEITLPTGLAAISSLTSSQVFGDLVTSIQQAGSYNILMNPSQTSMRVGFANTTNGGIDPSNGNDIATSATNISLFAMIPIEGWTSGVVSQNATTFQISSYLANGTQVTGGPPTKLGEYRSMTRSGASATTGADSTPTDLPNSANGIRIYASAYNAAPTSGQIQRYEIFVGKNKNVLWQFYASAGRTGYLSVDTKHSGGATVESVKGAEIGYDPSTGVAFIDTLWTNDGNDTTHELGDTFSGAGAISAVSDGYFDVIVSEKVIPVQIGSEISTVRLDTPNGFGSTNTFIRRWTNVRQNVGSAITYTDSATLGAVFTINQDGIYAISYSDAQAAGITLNESGGTLNSNINAVAAGEIIAANNAATSPNAAVTLPLVRGDVIRAHTNGAASSIGALEIFTITKVS